MHFCQSESSSLTFYLAQSSISLTGETYCYFMSEGPLPGIAIARNRRMF